MRPRCDFEPRETFRPQSRVRLRPSERQAEFRSAMTLTAAGLPVCGIEAHRQGRQLRDTIHETDCATRVELSRVESPSLAKPSPPHQHHVIGSTRRVLNSATAGQSRSDSTKPAWAFGWWASTRLSSLHRTESSGSGTRNLLSTLRRAAIRWDASLELSRVEGGTGRSRVEATSSFCL